MKKYQKARSQLPAAFVNRSFSAGEQSLDNICYVFKYCALICCLKAYQNYFMEITINQIENKIHSIRGMQVMLDSDLALMYQVEPRILNQSV
ncbi:MAG: ORF6N domain-containing protein, partial [Bacteroidota bacterium]|nr:ORF6N domain-containing protein [Bacteroidota bacterium]